MSNNPGGASTPIRKQDRPCWRFVDGQPCNDSTCPWTHRQATEDELRNRRSNSRGPRPKSGGPREHCLKFFHTGQCKHGDKCKFEHIPGNKQSDASSPGPKSPGKGKGRRAHSRGGKSGEAAPAAINENKNE